MFKHYTRKYKGRQQNNCGPNNNGGRFLRAIQCFYDAKKLSTDKTFSETARQEWQSIIRT